ncbi:hypothetical protein NZD89_20295 [Alicyclobacillus fastidiosus]|uniref:Uncharacterized protein n=1 Tax=Alicyclobacillus fastidiosus TaxID=392011 RepID=A0ABY6ZET1_9BACL|nr:hypothetical protein [Alicyclobacillus fastidiosus]WAH40631.1 hypothetical protein NZD89_20295 [Alicyclobacillus fastidiosus]GMA62077.1 hypothetical protein GCM10025859_25170 [Alicyclobacillus fastidiosus]
MTDGNPLGKAGRSIDQGVQNAADKASNGRLLDASKSVWDGTVKAGQEIGKSVPQVTNNLMGNGQNNK